MLMVCMAQFHFALQAGQVVYGDNLIFYSEQEVVT